MARHGFGHARLGVGAARVAEYRVEAVDGFRVGRLHPAHGIGNHARLIRMAEIARQHCIATGKPAVRLEAVDQPLQEVGGDGVARDGFVSRMAGELHGRQRPDLVAQTLKRETGRGVTHMPVNHVGLDGENVHRPNLSGHLGGTRAIG